MSLVSENAALPPVRTELQLLPGIREVNGLMSWLIFDPVRHNYYQIDEKYYAMLQHWECGTAGLLVDLLKHKGVTLEDIESLLRFLWAQCLTINPPANDLSYYSKNTNNKKRNWLTRLLHGYLFFIIPLVRPDKFLKRTEPLTRLFFTRAWCVCLILVAIVGLYLTSRQWDQFIHTAVHFFSLEGFFYFALALTFVKLAHECGHAYAATRYGCKIKSMGVAFIVMFPVLYTDTSDSWKITDKRKRLIINGAGVAVELSLAAIATMVWAFCDDGPLRNVAFFVATTSWILSILINMNPLMRFDAYYFLSDLLGIQNLQGRSFAMGRWSMREILFDIREPAPEAMPVKLMRGLTLFAWATWIYRFFLFLGIAFIVHAMFYRPFGSILAIVEITFFIAIPIMREMNHWSENIQTIATTRRFWMTSGLLAALILALVVPWQSSIRIPAMLESGKIMDIHAPADARIVETLVEQGDHVAEGETLLLLASDQIVNQVAIVEREIELRIALLNRIASDEQDLGQRIVIESELSSFREEVTGLRKTMDRLQVVAPFEGVIGNMNQNLHAARWTGEGQHLLTLTSNSGMVAKGFVERSNIGRLKDGAGAVFVPDLPELDTQDGMISMVDAANIEELNIVALASHYGGGIAVSHRDERLEPLKAWYSVNIAFDGNEKVLKQQQRGIVIAQGAPESIAERMWRRFVHVILREVII